MNTNKKLVFLMFFSAILLFLPVTMASAEGGRYFIKSNSNFWKNAFGVRNNFENGFTTDISEIQLRFAKMFGVTVEPVKVLQILPDENASENADVKPDATEVPKPKVIKGKTGTIRYIPTSQISWGIQAIYDSEDLTKTSGGKDIKVGILDTGVLTTHPDLKARVSECKDFTNVRTPIVDNKCDDKNGHGTHVAGIIAADAGSDALGIYGVAPEAKLFAYKVCGDNGSCYSDDIATAIRTAADHGVNVINMSLGSDLPSDLINNAISYASSKGVLIVAAAGNDGPFPKSIDWPGANASVVAVGALNSSLAIPNWSSRGFNLTTEPFHVDEGDIEFAAPGVSIESTANNGSYIVLSGTSMAAPFVSGLAAKYWQADETDPAGATRELLHSFASDILPLDDDDASGWGLPQVH